MNQSANMSIEERLAMLRLVDNLAKARTTSEELEPVEIFFASGILAANAMVFSLSMIRPENRPEGIAKIMVIVNSTLSAIDALDGVPGIHQPQTELG